MGVAIINSIALVIVAIIGLIGTMTQIKSNDKLKNQENILSIVNNKIETMQKKSDEKDEKLNKRINDLEMESTKRFLIVEMTKIQDGEYVPNEEEKKIIHEAKDIYEKLRGNSYVNSMFKRLVKKGIL